MKLFKKLSTLILTVALVVGTSVTVFAAPNDDVISALTNANLPATYIIQAENYLKTNTLTAAQSSAVVAKISDATAIMNAAGVKDISTLSATDKASVLADVTSAGNAIGLTINVVKQANGQFAITATDANGNIVVNFSSNEVKQTGLDNTLLYAGILMIILAAGSVFVLRKNSLTATTATA